MTKNELLPSNLEAFKKRFGTFHDAVIHHVKLDLYNGGINRDIVPYTMTIILGAIDHSLDRNLDYMDRWVNLTFEIVDVTKYALGKDRNYCPSIVFWLAISFFEDEIFMDLHPGVKEPPTADEYYKRNESFTSNNFLVIGKKCFWSVSPYQDRREHNLFDNA